MHIDNKLSASEFRRYSRQIILSEIGIQGQLFLKEKKILIVGSGGLGSPVILYLSAAGIGTLGIIDFDTIDETNLHRQVLFGVSDVGKSKANTAKQKVTAQNPDVKVITYNERLSADNAEQLFREYDLVVDCSDNFPTRYLVNDVCLLTGIPYVYASIYQFEGMLTVFADGNGPCYRCVFPEPPPQGMVPSCAEGGVLGVLPGILGTLQAAEAIKYLLSMGENLIGRLLQVDVLSMGFDEFKLEKNPSCKSCSNPSAIKLKDEQVTAVCETGSDISISAQQLAKSIVSNHSLKLIDVRSIKERMVAKIDNDMHISLQDIQAGHFDLELGDEIVVYCLSGQRSKQAVHTLKNAGYKYVRSLSGGILSWNSIQKDEV